MGLQSFIAKAGGDTWRSWRMLAVWPYPAVMIGRPHGKFTWDDYRCVSGLIKPGDFILTCSEPYILSNRGIEGAFKHAAVYVGPIEGYRDQDSGYILKAKWLGINQDFGERKLGRFERGIVHAISEGVVCQDVGELLFHADWVAVVRPWRGSDEQSIICTTALQQCGKEYDFDFDDSGPDHFFCTELAVYCAKRAGALAPETVRIRTKWYSYLLPFTSIGRGNVTLADYFVATYPLVCTSLSCNEPKFAGRSRLGDLLRERLRNAPDASS